MHEFVVQRRYKRPLFALFLYVARQCYEGVNATHYCHPDFANGKIASKLKVR